MPKQNQKPGPAREAPGPGRSTAQAAFNDVRKEIAQRNERAHLEARKLRATRDREQLLRRRERDLDVLKPDPGHPPALGRGSFGDGRGHPEEQLEIGPGVFKRLGDCTGSEIESAIRLIAQRGIDRAWIAEQAAGPDRGELTIARRFFANTTGAERDLIAYWQMVKLVEDAYDRYAPQGDA